jgi:hypothetical protein
MNKPEPVIPLTKATLNLEEIRRLVANAIAKGLIIPAKEEEKPTVDTEGGTDG